MANIELPKDAEGREIPLDTKVLYNNIGVGYEVNRFTFGFDVTTHEVEWTAESYGTGDMVYRLPVSSMHLERPDSLKQLMEDLNRVRDAHDERGKDYRDTPCDYDRDRGKYCNDCRLHNHEAGETCFEAMMGDIVSRVNRLYIDSKDDTAVERAAQDMIERAYTVGRMESSKAVARETARIIAEGIAKELGMTPGEEQTCDSR